MGTRKSDKDITLKDVAEACRVAARGGAVYDGVKVGYDQGGWVAGISRGLRHYFYTWEPRHIVDFFRSKRVVDCGSSCCVVGHARLIAGVPERNHRLSPAFRTVSARHSLIDKLSRDPSPRVLPLIKAAATGGDIRAIERRARASGLGVF